jgi:signal transduction histidine kinase
VTVRTRMTLSRAAGITTAVLVIAALGLTIGDRYTHAVDIPAIVAFLVGMAGLGVVGAMLTSRAPGNPIGPLFQVTGLLAALAIFASEYSARGLSDLQELPGVPFSALIADISFLPAGCALLTAYLIVPNGHVLGRRWAVALWLLWGGAFLATIGGALGTGSFEDDAGLVVDNPLSSGDHHLLLLVGVVGAWCVAIGGLVSLISVVVRFRRSQNDERQQLRWLMWAALLILASVVAMIVTGLVAGPDAASTANDLAWTAFLASILIGLPLATSVAVLRYRLYDLDLVVKKTAIYSIVAIVLTGLYLLLVGAAALAGLGSIPAVLIFVITFNAVRRRARRLADRIVYGKRATPFEVLSEFSERVGETYSIDDVLPRMVQLLSASTGAREVRAWIRTGPSMRPAAVAPADASTVADERLVGDDLPSFGDGVRAFAVTHQGELLGAITLAMASNDPMDASKERLAQGVASQAGLALRNVRLVEDLRASRRRIVAAQDERAKTLERNIHDGAQQQLVALAVKLRLAEQLAERDPAAVAAMLRDLQVDATTTLEDLRDLARGIYPPLLADKGLPAALEAQARKAMIPVELVPDGVGRYAPDVESGVYFCVLEALNNVAKYADASSAVIALSQTDAELVFEVRDDGQGFDPAQTPRGTGLQGMADRLDAIGGELVIETSIGAGTSVRGRIHVTPA